MTPHTARPGVWHCLVTALLMLLAGPSPEGRAQGYSVRRALVPADRPEDWPAGDWRAVRLADLERFLSRQRPASVQRSVLVRAEYTATLSGNELTAGRLQWDIHRAAGENDLELVPFGLAVGELNWSVPGKEPQPAAWGSRANQTIAVRLDGSSQRLLGDWSLRGRKIGEHVLFEVEFPRATSTLFRLRLPEGWALRSSIGDVQSGPEGLWEVHLAGQTRAQWTAFRMTDPLQRASILVQQECEYRLRQDGLMLRTAITPEVLNVPQNELLLGLDPNLELLSIKTPEGTTLPWRAVDSQGRIAVRLPEPLKGPGPRLQVDASGVFPPGRKVLLPQVRVVGGQLLTGVDDPSSGRIAVRIAAPLQLQDLKLQGCRQIDVAAGSDEERFVFRQFDPESRIELQISPAQWRANARVLTWLESDGETWQSRTACEWSVQAGSAFAVSCRVADGWDVINVQSSSRSTGRPDWSVDEQDGQRWLTVWFQEPLIPGPVPRLIIDARRFTGAHTVSLPIIAPRDVSQGQFFIGMSREDAEPLGLDPEGSFVLSTLSPVWSELGGLASVPGSDQALWMQSPILGAQARLTPRASSQPPVAAPPPPPPPAGPSRGLPPVVSNLAVRVRCALEGADLYRAMFRVQTDGGAQPFAFRLPEGTALADVRLNGQRAVPVQRAGSLELPLPADRTTHVVEVDYRAPVSRSLVFSRRELLLPRVPEMVFGLSLTVEPESDAWVGDLEGLGRDTTGSMAPRWIGPFAEVRRPGGDGRLLQAYGPEVPESCRLTVCARSRRWLGSWAVWSATLLAGLVLRVWPWRGRSLVVSLVLVGIAALIVLLPESTAVFAGAAHVAIWSAILLPQRWLVPPRPLLSLSPGRNFAVGPAAMASLLAIGFSQFPMAGAQETQSFVVLVPVDQQEQLSGEAPLAYVPPELERLLRESDPPADSRWRLRSVRYELDTDASGRPLIHAVCRVTVRPTGMATPVTLPLGHVNLAGDSACRVDGRPHPVLPGGTGSFVVVLDPEPASASPPEEVTHEIGLRLYPQADPDARDVFRVGLLSCPTSTLVRATPAFPGLGVTVVQGGSFALEAKLPEDGPLILGPASALKLSLGRERETGPAPGEVTTQVFTLCDVLAGLAYLQTRHVCRVTSGHVDAVSLVLPPDAAVRDVQTADLLRWDVTGSGSGRRLNVAWQRPQTGEFALRVVWTLPRTPGSPSIAVPGGAMTWEARPALHVTAQPQLFGWRRPLDLDLDVSAAGDVVAQPRTPEQFQAGFPGEGARPTAALEASSDSGWTLDPRGPASDVRARPRQTISIFPDRLHVAFEAPVSASAALRYQHRLAIPSQFTIERVRVLQNGVEQPMRWSRLADSLIIFLRDRATEQTLSVSGVWSGNLSGDVAVDLWQLPGVVAEEPEVVIWQSPELRVDVDTANLPAIPFPPENIPPVGAGISVGAFQSRSSVPVRLHVTKADLRWKVESRCTLERNNNHLDLAWSLRFSGDLLPGSSIPLILPPSVAGRARLTGKDLVVISQSRQPDGSERFEIGIPGASRTDFGIAVTARLPPASAPLEVPQIEIPGAAETNRTLLVRVEGLTLAGEAPARVRPLPQSGKEVQQFAIEPSGGRILLVEKSQSAPLPATSQLVYWSGGDTWHGRMRVTAPGSAGRIDLSWPQGRQPDSLVVDGRVLPVPSLTAGRRHIDVPAGSTAVHEILLAWNAAADHSLPLSGVARSGASTATFVPRSDRLLWIVGGNSPRGVPAPRNVPGSIVTTAIDGPAPTLHTIDAAIAQRAASIVFAACLGMVLVLATGRRWAQAIQTRPWLASLLLAVLWGLCTGRAWLSLVFPVIALLEAIVHRRRRQEAELPSTIYVTGQGV